MEFAKDELYGINYQNLGVRNKKKIVRFMKRHKFITTILVIGFVMGITDFILVYNFVQALLLL